MILNQDFREFISALNANEVRYLVVGGYAVALHGHPRYTKDIDIWIDRSLDNAKRMIRALEDFGFGSIGLEESDFVVEDQIIQLGYAPNRIDIITDLPGVLFDECFESRVVVEIDALLIYFIDLEQLKINKRSSGRHQDLADLENLE